MNGEAIEFVLVTTSGDPVVVSGFELELNGVSGFCIHETPVEFANAKRFPWTVTHMESSGRVSIGENRELAESAARDKAKGYDTTEEFAAAVTLAVSRMKKGTRFPAST